MDDSLPLVPPARLGTLLANKRTEQGLSRCDLSERARQLHLTFGPEELWDLEQGFITLTDQRLHAALTLYGVEAGGLMTERAQLVVDTDGGTLSSGVHTTDLARRQNTKKVLSRYVALLYVMRDQEPGTRLPLRSDDLIVLSEALDHDLNSVRADIHALMSAPATNSWVDRMQQRLRVPSAGLLVGLTAVGSLVITNHVTAQAAPATEVSEVGPAMQMARTDDTQVSAISMTRPAGDIADALEDTANTSLDGPPQGMVFVYSEVAPS